MAESLSLEEPLFSLLNKLSISSKTFRHPPVFTVEEAKLHHTNISGGHCKSLFVKDKKKNHALIIVDEDRHVNLKSLSVASGLGRLSFCSPDRLKDMLGVIPGSVTPFALINAQVPESGTSPISFILDKKMMQQEILNFHPLHNAATTTIKSQDLLVFARACGYEPLILDLDVD